jgi:N-acetylmuramoyl-L-alanine amidase
VGSPNFWEGRRDVQAIIYHTEVGTESGTEAEFQNAARQVSAHYSIGLDGTVHQYVEERNSAWHAGANWPDSTNANTRTIGVEREDRADPTTPMSPAQKAAWTALMGYLCQKYSVPAQVVGNGERGLISHHLINPVHSGCAGTAVEAVAQEFCSSGGVIVNPKLSAPISGIAASASGQGYWCVGRDGGAFSFGDAAFHGSLAGLPLNAPVVGITAARNGAAYWMVSADGGVFALPSPGAPFFGSMAGQALNASVVGIVGLDNSGYWLVGTDGAVFAFPSGQTPFFGSLGGRPLNAPIVSMAGVPGPTTQAYLLLGQDGGVFGFPIGTAPFFGSCRPDRSRGGHRVHADRQGLLDRRRRWRGFCVW